MRGLEKKSHEKGTEKQRYKEEKKTSQLLDQLGPEGRVGENIGTLGVFFKYNVSNIFLDYPKKIPHMGDTKSLDRCG